MSPCELVADARLWDGPENVVVPTAVNIGCSDEPFVSWEIVASLCLYAKGLLVVQCCLSGSMATENKVTYRIEE